MSKHFEAIRKYFRKGLYTKAHLEVLERKGVPHYPVCDEEY